MSHTANPPLHIAGAWDTLPAAGGFAAKLKWAAKQVAFFLYLYCGWVPLRDAVLSLLGKSRIIILYYHRVGWVDILSKPTGMFRAEMEYLARHYECLTLRQLMERLDTGVPITRKIAVVTFDDGYRDNYLSAFPELRRAGVPATFFVTTGYVGTDRRFPHDKRALFRGVAARDDWDKISWEELREMQSAGMEIGSHTVEHENLGEAPTAIIRREVRDSLDTLKKELGEGPRAFCFPWGHEEALSVAAADEIRSAGYYAAVTTLTGLVQPGDDRFDLRRIDAGNGQFSRLGVLATIEGFGWGWLARSLRHLLAKGL